MLPVGESETENTAELDLAVFPLKCSMSGKSALRFHACLTMLSPFFLLNMKH